MAAHSDATRSRGAGPNHESVMRAIIAGHQSLDAIQRAIGSTIAGYHLRQVIERMERTGMLRNAA